MSRWQIDSTFLKRGAYSIKQYGKSVPLPADISLMNLKFKPKSCENGWIGQEYDEPHFPIAIEHRHITVKNNSYKKPDKSISTIYYSLSGAR